MKEERPIIVGAELKHPEKEGTLRFEMGIAELKKLVKFEEKQEVENLKVSNWSFWGCLELEDRWKIGYKLKENLKEEKEGEGEENVMEGKRWWE